MFEDIKILEDEFSDDERKIYQALLKKKDWLNIKLIRSGNLDYYVDEKNNKRYPFLEHLFDNVVFFKKPQYTGKFENKEKINLLLEDYNIAIFQTKINLKNDAPFYVEYDFNKLDELGYRALLANFYKMHNEDDLEIKYDKLEEVVNQIKLCCIGNKDDYCFVLANEALINGCFFLPIVSKIYIAKQISEDLFNDLEYYAKMNKVQIEVIYENTKDN